MGRAPGPLWRPRTPHSAGREARSLAGARVPVTGMATGQQRDALLKGSSATLVSPEPASENARGLAPGQVLGVCVSAAQASGAGGGGTTGPWS